MVHIAGLGHADHRVDQQVRFDLAGCKMRDLLVCAVHRVAGLERHHLAPAELLEARPHFGRAFAQVLEVVVGRRLDAPQLAAHVDGARDVVEEVDRRVFLVGRAEYAFGLPGLVRGPDVAHFERGKDHALEIAQGHLVTRLQFGREVFADIQRHRHRPEHAAREAHVADHRIVIIPVEEALERREGAVQQQLDVTELALGKVPRHVVACRLLLSLRRRLVEVEILQLAAMRLFKRAHCLDPE